jgi:hypothetical protein
MGRGEIEAGNTNRSRALGAPTLPGCTGRGSAAPSVSLHTEVGTRGRRVAWNTKALDPMVAPGTRRRGFLANFNFSLVGFRISGHVGSIYKHVFLNLLLLVRQYQRLLLLVLYIRNIVWLLSI